MNIRVILLRLGILVEEASIRRLAAACLGALRTGHSQQGLPVLAHTRTGTVL